MKLTPWLVRGIVRDGQKLPEQISEADLQDDEKLMIPVLPDDAFIMSLDDLPSSDNAEGADSTEAGEGKTDSQTEGSTAALQARIDELTQQFANYRFAVEQTLDKRWLADDEPSKPSTSTKEEKRDESQYYWESYASHGMSRSVNTCETN